MFWKTTSLRALRWSPNSPGLFWNRIAMQPGFQTCGLRGMCATKVQPGKVACSQMLAHSFRMRTGEWSVQSGEVRGNFSTASPSEQYRLCVVAKSKKPSKSALCGCVRVCQCVRMCVCSHPTTPPGTHTWKVSTHQHTLT